MRLLNLQKQHMQEFFDEQTPPYAVVSHRWGEKEITYQDYLTGRRRDAPGYEKIVKCSEIALSNGLEWMWIDTVCIDKTSSAELTEAVNSMYMWYQKAVECYAILPDLNYSPDRDDMLASLAKSVWFSRGWTLQELLAPKVVVFFDSRFQPFASKVDLADALFDITGIRKKFMVDSANISSASIAERMSWAAHRHTTRVEDMAYCLLGLFGVNMPLLYGEREKAFFRLQLEIMKSSDDESIFAWTSKELKVTGMLASWPSDFASSGRIRRFAVNPEYRLPWTWTSRGLEIRLFERDHASSLSTGTKFPDPMPVGQHSKLITLGCWLCQATSAEEEDEDASISEKIHGRIVAITIERNGSGWQRTEANRTILMSTFEALSRSMGFAPIIVRHYYIPQENLAKVSDIYV